MGVGPQAADEVPGRAVVPWALRAKRTVATWPIVRTLERRRRRARREPAPPEDPDTRLCESVLDWALAHPGTEYARIFPADEVVKTPPHTIEPEVHWKFVESPVFRINEKYVVRLDGAILEAPPNSRGASAPGLGCPRLVLPDGSVSLESTQLHGEKRRPLPREAARPMPGDYFSLLSLYAWPGNYYHWTHDVLLSLFGVGPHLPADVRYVVPPNLGSVQRESLAMLGIGAEQLVPFDLGATDPPAPSWELERLHFSPGPMGPSASPIALDWLRSTALDYAGATDRAPHRLVYISRRNARHRRTVNEPEVIAHLVDRGFEIHELDDYSLREQITLFAETKVLVGPHGAGHTNMIFASRGLVVVDILGSEVNKCFHNLALTLGHDYWYMFGNDVPSNSRYTDDISVPVDKLDSIVSLALAGASS